MLDSLREARAKNFTTTHILINHAPSVKESAHAHVTSQWCSYTLVGVVWRAILRKLIILSISLLARTKLLSLLRRVGKLILSNDDKNYIATKI